MTHVTCRLTAKNRDPLRNPTFGNRVSATFTFLFPIYLLLSRWNVTSRSHCIGAATAEKLEGSSDGMDTDNLSP